jgi:hypothetical protein
MISQEQLKMAQANFDPDLYIENHNQQGIGEVIEIVNTGGPIHNLRVIIDTFVSLLHVNNKANSKTLMPFTGYYDSSTHLGQVGSVYNPGVPKIKGNSRKLFWRVDPGQ